jgi:hypothetical protein
VLNVQLQSEVKRMAALAGVAGQEWLLHSTQAVYTAAEQVRHEQPSILGHLVGMPAVPMLAMLALCVQQMLVQQCLLVAGSPGIAMYLTCVVLVASPRCITLPVVCLLLLPSMLA